MAVVGLFTWQANGAEHNYSNNNWQTLTVDLVNLGMLTSHLIMPSIQNAKWFISIVFIIFRPIKQSGSLFVYLSSWDEMDMFFITIINRKNKMITRRRLLHD